METMKDSGIEWIGEIPAEWDINKIKYLSVLKGRIGWQGLTSDEYTDEGAYLITGVDFSNGGIDWTSCVHVPMHRWEEAKEIQIENGDLLITKDGTIGKVAVVSECPGPTSLNSGVLRISTYEGYDRKFLYWVLKSDVFWTWFADKNAGNSTIQHLYQGDFAEFKYAVPSLKEQQAIAKLLDNQCAKIDDVIADITKQIELLQQYKKSLITETVTKGLDKSVPMKDSGVEWIGEIPEHWHVIRMQDFAEYKKGPFGSAITVDMFVEKGNETYKVYEQKNAIKADETLGWYYLDYNDYTRLKDFAVRPKDIIVSCAGTIGKCHILPDKTEEGIINQALMRVRLNNGFDEKYFIYLFDVALQYMNEKYSNGSAIKNIPPFSILKKQNIAIPDENEQKDIVQYLDDKCSLLDELLESKQKQLEIITEHKKSLIYEYVTGKKRVKEVQ